LFLGLRFGATSQVLRRLDSERPWTKPSEGPVGVEAASLVP
jgi:hypothetical protein